jgi:hypothetical protein
VAGGEPVAQVRGQEEGLVAVTAQEVVGHGPSYSFTAFVPNALILSVNAFGAKPCSGRIEAVSRLQRRPPGVLL